MTPRLFLFAVVVSIIACGCGPRPSDRVFYLYSENVSDFERLIRVVWNRNEVDDIPDDVYSIPAGTSLWIDHPRSGRMPNGVEVLAYDCLILGAVAVPMSGVVRISSATEASFVKAPIPAGIADAQLVTACPNR